MTASLHDLERRIGAIISEVVTEADRLPGQSLTWGRPHDHARVRHEPRYSRTGERIAGTNLVRPDCPRPRAGRCECPTDGSWRPIGGAQRADLFVLDAEFVRTSQVAGEDGRYPGHWTDRLYVQGPDGLWRCTRPMRRALQRLQGETTRRYLVMTRLFDGDSLAEAWADLGQPVDLVTATLGICAQLEQMAEVERVSEYEKRPHRWRAIPWVEKSDAQQRAEEEGAA